MKDLKSFPYKIELNVYHGKRNESITEAERLLMIGHDSIFKMQSLFWLVMTISTMANEGHQRFDNELMLHALDEIGQIGWAIASATIDPIEKLEGLVKEDKD